MQWILMLPLQFFVSPPCGQDQHYDVVDQDQANRKQERPKHRLPKVKLLVLVQSCKPATT